MIANNHLGGVFFYAQTLDNSGDSICKHAYHIDVINNIDDSDPCRAMMLQRIDKIAEKGRSWLVSDPRVSFRILLNGDCLLTIIPLTLDDSGRWAPIQVLFNVYNSERNLYAELIHEGVRKMGRVTPPKFDENVKVMSNILCLPFFLILLHVFFNRVKNND
ncbi:hypothetical protein P0F07_000479 [Vibrio metschnikovii]|uniref:hypothetical protein n=1 Tax=Vibrio TaxID=662 RepID=UPI0014836D02|nr:MULTISPECIES: hypothetical protein [Vibrio]EKO3578273.1 hypothetical protein [Vibrio metschnikovii]EKO3677984.1 hypothetical protein [Vibrio metschnikovii]EKO3685716.1 hypothetical protein [Vibrio metschnikovii]EKO3689097.1 hypothetical protein [Vibrio metschnikovii]EKO3892167.1 hypothetical protein [Vibrio metschnikovii]